MLSGVNVRPGAGWQVDLATESSRSCLDIRGVMQNIPEGIHAVAELSAMGKHAEPKALSKCPSRPAKLAAARPSAMASANWLVVIAG
ncbi:hypothetical protein L1887_59950 [Cichorium endivia]|nr:hypothetical protein L1887_59950 [Cichorium endivia]